MRVWEVGKSECLAVMARIGVAPPGNITPRESGQTSDWCWMTKKLQKLVTRCSVDMEWARPTGAASQPSFGMTNPSNQYRQGLVLCSELGWLNAKFGLPGLEPIRLEIFHIRFLGGGGLATAPCYPT